MADEIYNPDLNLTKIANVCSDLWINPANNREKQSTKKLKNLLIIWTKWLSIENLCSNEEV